MNTADRNIVSTTKSLDVLVEKDEKNPTDKVITVKFVTADGKLVMTTTVVVDADAKTIKASSLKEVPYGFNLVSKGDLEIDEHNTVRVVVAAKETDPKKDKVPKTGDDFNAVMWATISVITMAAAAAMISLKMKAENR